jgi:hypothetical protein
MVDICMEKGENINENGEKEKEYLVLDNNINLGTI